MRLASAALEAGFHDIVVEPGFEDVARLGRFRVIHRQGDRFVADGAELGRLVAIRSPQDEKALRSAPPSHRHLVIEASDWKVIPLENLIAHFQGRGTKVLATASTADEAKLFFETLELGVDGVLFQPRDEKEIAALRKVLEVEAETVPLLEGKVVAIRPLGVGDRVCVDTCSMFLEGEGILVGNASSGMFLMHSERLASGYVEPRPFRVNAGPVHAYVLVSGGKTKYLSELKAGDEVLAVDAEGRGRHVVVGRVKIERRPLVLVEAEAGGHRFSTIVQNAETIRFTSPGSKAISVSELKVGDTVLVRTEEGGRHFGMHIKETITEK